MSEIQDRRLQLCYVSSDLMLDILNGALTVADLDAPADARVVRVFFDDVRDAIGVVLASAEFEFVPFGSIPPAIAPLQIRRVLAEE